MSKRHQLLWAALIVAACIVTYANGLGGAFTYDDKAIVRDNPRIRSPHNLEQIFTTSYFGGPRGTGSAYRPVLLLSYAVEWWIHGKDVVAFHAVNIGIHAAVTLLLAALLLRIGLPPPAAGVTALVFAVHPIHVEAVTSLVGRGETLTALFVLLYLHLSLSLWRGAAGAGDAASGKRPGAGVRWVALAAALLCYAAAILSKESGAVAPALAVLLFVFIAEGSVGARLVTALRRGLPLLLLSAVVLAAAFALRSWVLGGPLRSSSSGIFEVENALAPLRPAARMANACVLFFRYLGRSLFPLHLSGDESAWSIRPAAAFAPLPVAAGVLLALLTLASLLRLRVRSAPALGLLFFGLALLPTSNLLYPIGTIFAERIVYLPSAGVCLMLASVLVGSAPTLSAISSVRLRVLLAIAVLFSARGIIRNAVWWNDTALFANLVATAPASAKAHYDAAYVAAGTGRYRQARDEYARAVAIYGAYWDAWAGKGRVEKELGLLENAERSYERSIAVHPAYENGHFGLGQVREARGNDAGAEKAYRKGLAEVPKSLPLAYRLALLTARHGKPEAAADWRLAVKLGEENCSVRSGFARWLIRQGKTAEAQREAQEILRKDQTCAEAARVLADLAAQQGKRLARALALEKAYRASKAPEDLAALERLAREDPAYANRFAMLRPTLRLRP